MKYLFTAFAIAVTGAFSAQALDIGQEETPVQIYAVSTMANDRGVYTLPISGEFNPVKISGTTYVQYSFAGSGGTFTSKEALCGTSYNYSNYAIRATAEGGEDGPWSHTYYNYRDSQNLSYPSTILATDMTYDAPGKKVYGWFRRDDAGSTWGLGIYDPEAVSVTEVGEATTTKLHAIAADADGALWGIDGTYGTLYSIDKTTGALTQVKSFWLGGSDPNQSACIDPATGLLYWCAIESALRATLYCIDIKAQTIKEVYQFPMGRRFSGFYIPVEQKKGVPAPVADLSGLFTTDGVVVTFTAPALTAEGADLAGELAYELLLDGSALDSGSIAPGAAYSKTFAMSEGSHALELKVSNDKGFAEPAMASVFVGYDTPGAPGNPTATLAGDGNVNLSWEAATGVNGGVLDFGRITYSIVRNPGNVAVASGLAATEFTDVTDADARQIEYVYTVSSCFDGEAVASASTNPVMVGKPYTIPYEQTFDSESSLAEMGIKVIDLDNNGTWELKDDGTGNQYVETIGGDYRTRRDYLFFPFVSLKAGVTYTLAFRIANDSQFHGTQLRIFLSRSQSDNSDDFVSPYINPNFDHRGPGEGYEAFTPYEMNFTVEQDGDYSLGFYDFGTYYTDNAITLDDVSIREQQSGIGSVSVDRTDDADAVYTLDGRRVPAGNLRPGLYVKGYKVVRL